MTSIDELRPHILTTDQLIGRGYSTQSLGRAVTTGELVRLRPGYYVNAHTGEFRRADRHRLLVLAVDAAFGQPVFTHWSAALIHGLPDWGLPLRQTSISRYGQAQRSRSTRRVRHDLCPIAADEIVTVDGVLATSAERTIIDIARVCNSDVAAVVADAGLNSELITESSLDEALGRAAGRAGVKRARKTIELADRKSESVAETRSRILFSDFGLPEPETQVDIMDESGNFVARVDFFWPEFGIIGECDGVGKYFDGADETETRRRLEAEKDRDARLVALGFRVIHWRWADIERPMGLMHRLRRMMESNASA